MAGIELKGVNKSYNLNGNKISVLKDFSLSLKTNEITVILGKSGCGKTTLLKLIQGLENVDSGKIIYENLKITTVFQESLLMPWLNVYDNITFSLNKKDIIQNEINDLLNLIGLKKYEKAFHSSLSGGMKARVSLARALAYNPDYILMDEPFASLDYFTKEQMQNEVIKLQKHKKCGILFVTHSIDEALLLAHKIIIMDSGNIKETYEITDEERDLLSNKFIELKKLIIKNLKER